MRKLLKSSILLVVFFLVVYVWLMFNWDKYYISYTGLVWKGCRGSLYIPDTNVILRFEGLIITKCIFHGDDEPWYLWY